MNTTDFAPLTMTRRESEMTVGALVRLATRLGPDDPKSIDAAEICTILQRLVGTDDRIFVPVTDLDLVLRALNSVVARAQSHGGPALQLEQKVAAAAKQARCLIGSERVEIRMANSDV
jgi:hypothetical protein